MCPRDVWVNIDGYDRRMRVSWEQTRLMCYYIVAMQADPKKFKDTPQSFMPFEWDRKGGKSKKEMLREVHKERMRQKREAIEKAAA